ncbi:MAG: response regulator [Cyanobacteriota bacterium]|nr:response regulator [Cyanobacteriota bacterium]
MATKKLSILLVDDDEVDVMTVKRAFRKNELEHQLWVASNGLEALDILRGNQPKSTHLFPNCNRLILLDLNMPKMGGIEFLQEMRADNALKAIPVVILTTSNEDKDKVSAYNFNVAGYLIKPVTFDKFVKTIATLNQYWLASEIL